MASAILTVLYPETFTIYDIRVCNILNNYHRIQNRTNFDTLWLEYETYIAAVRASVQEDYTLRDKDRWLWGKSFCLQLQKAIESNFNTTRETTRNSVREKGE